MSRRDGAENADVKRREAATGDTTLSRNEPDQVAEFTTLDPRINQQTDKRFEDASKYGSESSRRS